MFRALHTSASGMRVQQLTVDNIAHNLANANTTAYKKSRVEFHDLLYLNMGLPQGEADGEKQLSAGMQIGSGAKAIGNLKNFYQGTTEVTNRELDVAINGDGFFQLTSGDTICYSRDGSFKVDANRQLVSSHGFPIYPPINIPEKATRVYVGKDGAVSVSLQGEQELQTIGQIILARFANRAGLSSEGENVYHKTAASGEPLLNKPSEEGMGHLVQNSLERSNVDVVEEMVKLINAQRAYEINSKVIRSGDEMLSMVNNLVR